MEDEPSKPVASCQHYNITLISLLASISWCEMRNISSNSADFGRTTYAHGSNLQTQEFLSGWVTKLVLSKAVPGGFVINQKPLIAEVRREESMCCKDGENHVKEGINRREQHLVIPSRMIKVERSFPVGSKLKGSPYKTALWPAMFHRSGVAQFRSKMSQKLRRLKGMSSSMINAKKR